MTDILRPVLFQTEGNAATLDRERPPHPFRLILLWLLAGGAMLFMLGGPPVRRTQEARVLETARQMMDAPLRGWLLPQLNGQPRLKKPPVTYWMTAGMYKLLGVSEGVGRIPSVVCGWLTLGLTYAAARRLFGNARTALLCAACLLGSYLFFRYNRLAETDSPATFFVTLSICAMLRAFEVATGREAWDLDRRPGRELLWMFIAGLGIGGAVMAKGAPAAFPLLFLMGMALITRQWRPLRSFLLAGVPIAALVGGAWYLYVYKSGYFGVLVNEIRNNAEGGDHGKPFYYYVPMLLTGVAPWTAVWIAATIIFVRRRGTGDRVVGVVLLWAGVLFVPLCFIGNKQFHYLLPAMPPLAIITGAVIARATRPSSYASAPSDNVARAIVGWTIALTLLFAIGTPLTGLLSRKHVLPIDFLVSAIGVVAAVIVALAWQRKRMVLAIGTYALAVTFAISLLDARWLLTIQSANPRVVAKHVVEEVGPGPYFFYGGNVSLPLCFNLRTAIPTYSIDQLLEVAARQPTMIVIVVSKDGKPPVPPPSDRFAPISDLTDGEQAYNFYRFAPAPPTTPR